MRSSASRALERESLALTVCAEDDCRAIQLATIMVVTTVKIVMLIRSSMSEMPLWPSLLFLCRTIIGLPYWVRSKVICWLAFVMVTVCATDLGPFPFVLPLL